MTESSATRLLLSFIFVFNVQFACASELALSASEWRVLYQQANAKISNGDKPRAIQDYDELVNRCPAEIPRHELADCFYQLACCFSDYHFIKEYLQKAKAALDQSKEKPADMICIYFGLVDYCGLLNETSQAEAYAAQGADYAKKSYGDNLQCGQALVYYANAAAKNHNYALSQRLVNKIDELRSKASLDERRAYETEVLSRLGQSFRERKEYADAEKYCKEAILAGESLWYPLYSWNRKAFLELAVTYSEQNKEKECERTENRWISIEKTGFDPDGVNVCKYWNGKKAPDGPHVTIGVRITPSESKQLKRTPPAVRQDPLLVYKRIKKR